MVSNNIFLEIGKHLTHCVYCNADMTFNGDGGKKGYTRKKCKACGKINLLAIDMTGDLVNFTAERKRKKVHEIRMS